NVLTLQCVAGERLGQTEMHEPAARDRLVCAPVDAPWQAMRGDPYKRGAGGDQDRKQKDGCTARQQSVGEPIPPIFFNFRPSRSHLVFLLARYDLRKAPPWSLYLAFRSPSLLSSATSCATSCLTDSTEDAGGVRRGGCSLAPPLSTRAGTAAVPCRARYQAANPL